MNDPFDPIEELKALEEAEAAEDPVAAQLLEQAKAKLAKRDETANGLDKLASVRAKIAMLQAAKAAKAAEIMAPIQEQLTLLDEATAPAILELEGQASALDAKIRSAVLELKESVQGQKLQCSFVSGRVSWDTDFLLGLAESVPAILKAKTEGDPSTAIKNLGGKK